MELGFKMNQDLVSGEDLVARLSSIVLTDAARWRMHVIKMRPIYPSSQHGRSFVAWKIFCNSLHLGPTPDSTEVLAFESLPQIVGSPYSMNSDRLFPSTSSFMNHYHRLTLSKFLRMMLAEAAAGRRMASQPHPNMKQSNE